MNWISVEDEMPEADYIETIYDVDQGEIEFYRTSRYFVVYDGEKIQIADFNYSVSEKEIEEGGFSNGSGVWLTYSDDEIDADCVTHWAELPEAPK